MLVTDIKCFPPVAEAADNPYNTTISLTGNMPATGKFIALVDAGSLVTPAGPAKRGNFPIFDYVLIDDGAGTCIIRKIDFINSGDDTPGITFTETIPGLGDVNIFPLKRMAFNDAHCYVQNSGDKVRCSFLNENAMSEITIVDSLSIPKDQEGLCIPFVIDGSSTNVIVVTSPEL